MRAAGAKSGPARGSSRVAVRQKHPLVARNKFPPEKTVMHSRSASPTGTPVISANTRISNRLPASEMPPLLSRKQRSRWFALYRPVVLWCDRPR